VTSRAEKVELLSLLEEKAKRNSHSSTVVGFVCPDKGFTHALSNKSGTWKPTKAKPDVYLGAKLEKVLTSTKRFIGIFGGRGSMKSIGGADICLIDAKDNNAKTYFLREFQSSIKNSVHSLLKDEITRLEFEGFDAQATSIKYKDQDSFEFAGLSRNIASIKSSHGFKRYSVEEAQFLSAESLKELTPTARNKPNKGLPLGSDELKELQSSNDTENVSMMFIANPGSEEDPLSKRFIVPFQEALDRDGFYEDDLHLIVIINYTDNPWFKESGLEQERLWAYNNLDRSLYDHIWLGKYNDSIEGSIIRAEWFDACIDAHKKLGFEATGAKIASHDPSDTGPDSKGYAFRHGSVFQDVQEKVDGDGNEGGHWAAGLANSQGADYFTWDCDGMGALLNEQMSKDFKDKPTKLVMFKGSETPDNPEAIYRPALKSPVANQLKIKDAVKNKRAQYYTELRDRIYRTYEAVIKGIYHDPDTLISFDSSIVLLSKLRAELCRMPIKDNGAGKIELYTKQEMKSRFNFSSPNLADPVMMSMRYIQPATQQVVIPKPIRPMGRR